MKTIDSIGSESLGYAGEDTLIGELFFDATATIYSQYANSPAILALIASLNSAIDRQTNIDDFYNLLWDVDTANAHGLDVWGRIVGVGRALYISEGTFLGFSEATDAKAFDDGIFYGGTKLTANYLLTDEAYRRVIIAKAAANITDGSISSLNAILMSIFTGYGNCYVRDNLDMTMTLVFGAKLSKVDYAIITQSGVLPRPVGVSFTVEQP